VLKVLTLVVILLITVPNQVAYGCCGCMSGDCSSAANAISQHHQEITNQTNQEFDDDLRAFQNWVTDVYFAEEIVPALRMMTTQMNAVAMQHTQIVGSFLDAKNQMDTQRLFQELQTEAHKDYIPSDDFCWFGTNIRSMPASKIKSRLNTYSLSAKSIDRQLGNVNTKGADSIETDLDTRWRYFRTRYCDPSDNNRSPLYFFPAANRVGTGLELACDHDGPGGSTNMGADETFRTNIDVDYTRLVESPRTINVDFSDGNATTDNEIDIVALSENLYGHRVLSREIVATELTSPAAKNLYYALRSVVSKRNVAQNTFDSIVGLKSRGSAGQYENNMGGLAPLALGHTRQYLAAIVRDLYSYNGITPQPTSPYKLSDWDIYSLIGDDPSYYSQLEIMAKKLYQNPDFYVKLYDTPANVARKGVAMKAIELMVDREMYESQLRREMSASILLSSRLRAKERAVSAGLVKGEAVVKQ
jgi:hypothetical protein